MQVAIQALRLGCSRDTARGAGSILSARDGIYFDLCQEMYNILPNDQEYYSRHLDIEMLIDVDKGEDREMLYAIHNA